MRKLNVKVIQTARYKSEQLKHPAIVEIGGVRFFSVTPGDDEGATKINQSVIP